MDVSVIIPVYNALELAKACVTSVFAHGSSLAYEVIVVDNGSALDVETWLLEEEVSHSNLRHLRSSAPLGFAGAVNLGAATAAGEVFIILNSDTLVSSGWIEGLYQALKDDPLLGVLSPVTNHAGEPAQMDFGTVDLSPTKAFAAFNKKAGKHGIFYLPQRITFFCVALRRSVWQRFHGLDEAYGVGNFEDDDLCLRLRVAGFRLGVLRDVFVYHHNNATFEANGISHTQWMQKNARTFAKRACQFAEEPVHEMVSMSVRLPKRLIPEISVVILPTVSGSLQRTLLSLANQTIANFEIIEPKSEKELSGLWVAYITQGDIFYPFHLEALFDALERTGSTSIFADVWIDDSKGAGGILAHPDTTPSLREAPLLLAGWMHHASLDPERLWQQSIPMHWPRITWQMQEAPTVDAEPPAPAATAKARLVEAMRHKYRQLVSYETRLTVDRRVRSFIGRPVNDESSKVAATVGGQLETLLKNGVDRGRFAVDREALPAVFLFNVVPWNSAVQRPHHFARQLADRGHTVFWIDTVMNPAPNWWTGKPLPQVYPCVHLVRLPSTSRDIYGTAWDDATISAMESALMQTAAAYGIREAALLVNYPRWQPVITKFQVRSGWKIAVDCLDDQRAFAAMYQIEYGRFEELLIESADLILTSSVVLRDRMLPRPSILIQNANDFELFSSATPIDALMQLGRPVVGFFGALANWLDMDLIHAAAIRYPEWTFVYIGPNVFPQTANELQWLRSTDLPNILVLPQMNPPLLARHLAAFDVCTIPFLDIPVTRAMNPVKLYEYFAAGKPTVSRDLPEIRYLAEGEARDLFSTYTTQEEYFERLEQAVSSDTVELKNRRQAFAKQNDWSHRCDALSHALLQMVQGISSISPASRGSNTLSQE